jgi:hypothetical protein
VTHTTEDASTCLHHEPRTNLNSHCSRRMEHVRSRWRGKPLISISNEKTKIVIRERKKIQRKTRPDAPRHAALTNPASSPPLLPRFPSSQLTRRRNASPSPLRRRRRRDCPRAPRNWPSSSSTLPTRLAPRVGWSGVEIRPRALGLVPSLGGKEP